MSRIAKPDVHAALRRAADHLIAAGGTDGRISRKDLATKLATLAGVERALVDLLFHFADYRDSRRGATVTHAEVEAAHAHACEQLVDAYDVNDNGLSAGEVGKMSTLAQLAVALAHELAGAPPPDETPASFDAARFQADITVLTQGLTLMSESDAMFKPVVATLAPAAPLDANAVVSLFAAAHLGLARDIFGPDDPNVFDLAKAHSDVREFGWLARRRVSPDPDDPQSVEQATRTGALVDHLAANLSDLHVYAYSNHRSGEGDLRGKISLFIVGRAPEDWVAGVFTASVET